MVQRRKCSHRERLEERRKQEFLVEGSCFPEEYVKGEKCKYSVMRHKGRSTKENAPGREGKEEQVEVAAWHVGAAVQDSRSSLWGYENQ